MWETFNVYESWLDHDEIESKIIWLENDYKNLSHSQEVSNAIKQNILDAIKQLPIDKKKDYKLEYQNKAIKAEWKLKGLYYELAAWVINTISAEKKSNYIPQINNLQETNESLNKNNISVIRWNIVINQIVSDWKSRANIAGIKFDVPKFKKTKVNVQLNTILEQKISDGEIRLKFWSKDWYEPKVINLNYEETSTHITFYYDKNDNWDLDRYESRKSKTLLKQTMRTQHDSYYYTTNINLRDLWIPWVKRWGITLKIKKTD